MAKLRVTPVVLAGLNRGGENLFLDFKCTVEGETVPTEFDVLLDVDDDHEGLSVELEDEEDEEDEEGETEYTDENPYRGKVKYHTNHYEFEWEGTSADALALLGDKLKNNRLWQFCHHPGETPRLQFKYRHYVAGNAE